MDRRWTGKVRLRVGAPFLTSVAGMVVWPGDIAPAFRLPTVWGEVRSLSEATARGRHVLLVFLRHLG